LFSIFTSKLKIESGSELIYYASDTKLGGIAFAGRIKISHRNSWITEDRSKKKRMQFNSTKFKVMQIQPNRNFCQELAAYILPTAEEKEKT